MQRATTVSADAAREQSEAIRHPVEDLRRAQHRDAGSRQLDGERHTVEPAADLPDREVILLAQVEAGVGGLGALDEQFDRRRLRVAVVQGGNRHHHLAVDAEALAGGGEQRRRRRLTEQPLGELDRSVEDVLAVVEDQQRVALGEVVDELVDRCGATDEFEANGTGDRGGELLPFRYGGQIREVAAIPPAREFLEPDFDCESGLATTADAGERDHRGRLEQRPDLAHLVATADDHRSRCGQRRQSRVDRTQGPVRFDAHLMDRHGVGHVAQPVGAEETRLDVDHGLHGLGHENLATIGQTLDSRRGVGDRTEVVAVALRCAPTVQAHPDSKRGAVAPVELFESMLDRARRSDR